MPFIWIEQIGEGFTCRREMRSFILDVYDLSVCKTYRLSYQVSKIVYGAQKKNYLSWRYKLWSL